MQLSAAESCQLGHVVYFTEVQEPRRKRRQRQHLAKHLHKKGALL